MNIHMCVYGMWNGLFCGLTWSGANQIKVEGIFILK